MAAAISAPATARRPRSLDRRSTQSGDQLASAEHDGPMNETVRDAQAGEAPTLFLMVGLPGSGKTVRARELAAERGALRLTADDWALSIFGQEDRHQGAARTASGGYWKVDSSHWPSTPCAYDSASCSTSDCGRATSARPCAGWPLRWERYAKSCTCRWNARCNGAGFRTDGNTRQNRHSPWPRRSSTLGETRSRSPTQTSSPVRFCPSHRPGMRAGLTGLSDSGPLSLRA